MFTDRHTQTNYNENINPPQFPGVVNEKEKKEKKFKIIFLFLFEIYIKLKVYATPVSIQFTSMFLFTKLAQVTSYICFGAFYWLVDE